MQAYQRSIAGSSLGRKVFLYSLLGSFLAALLVFCVPRLYGKPPQSDGVMVWAILTACVLLVTAVRGSFGRSVVVTEDMLVSVPLGSRTPRRVLYESISHCGLREITVSEDTIMVLDVFGTDGKLDEIELPDSVEAATVVEFLRDRGVRVDGRPS